MSDETAVNVGAVVKNLSQANNLTRQAEILGRAITSAGPGPAVEMMGAFMDKALDDLGYARGFLLCIDFQLLNKTVGAKVMEQMKFHMDKHGKFAPLAEILEQTKNMDQTTLMFLKAKTAMYIQLVYLLRGRVQDEGMPQMMINSPALVNQIILAGDIKKKEMVVDLTNFGTVYKGLLSELLEEADFTSKDDKVYTSILTDSSARRAADGMDLVSSGKEGESGKLSEAVMGRMGANIIKRLSLLLKTVKMYSSADHPSISLALETLHNGIDDLLQDREKVSLSRLGSDVLIEDVKLKKAAQFINDFAIALEERNVNSLTFRKGITLDEVRTFVLIFAETASQIKNRGGVKGILDSKGVTHIVVDQFKYGIITDDGQAEKDDMTSDEKALDNLVFTEIVNKIKQGGDLGDVNAEGVAAAFQSLMSGSYKKDAKSRANLAQMILSLDPSLADQALFASGGLKDAMSWSTARTTINQLLDDIGRGKPENRVHALENLAKMADMAISKNKDTTINEMVTRLNERIWFKERDIDVNAQIFDVLVDFFKALIVAYKHTAAMEIIRQIEKLDRTLDNLPDDKQDNYTRALKELCATSFVQASAEATVEVLMRELESDVMSIADQAMKILETLRTEQVVEQLLEGFKNDSRTTRNRCFQTLMAIGPKALEVCVWKVKNLDDPSMFPRRDTVGTLDDSAFYVARNAIDLIAKLGGASEMDVLRKAASDKDARVRREVLSAMPKVDATEAGHMAANFLQDPSKDVVEVAINTLGMLQDQSAAGKLIDLFYADPDIRAAVINALGKIGGKEAEELMLPATRFRFGGHLVQIYKTNEELRLLAIRNLGLLGREPARNALKKFVGRWTNPIIRPLFFPLGELFRHKELTQVAKDSLSRVEHRLTHSAA